jgi:hypothetical protein
VTATAELEAAAPTRGLHSKGVTRRLFEPSEVTLEDSILGAWEALTAHGRCECPVCAGELEPAGGCPTCGSELS